MSTVFKILLYLGVALGLAGFFLGSFQNESFVQDVAAAVGGYDQLKQILSFGGVGLILVGLVGRTATRKTEVEWK